ncbi:hypothetical protein BDW59DRAFT_151680 [Aspergillus cavernicola]|uniref:Uncharacterized protein n=1 Tax=Aspergillus cavernicola TaxID=176166 RepID=A0ABR4HUJ2_9EURO
MLLPQLLESFGFYRLRLSLRYVFLIFALCSIFVMSIAVPNKLSDKHMGSLAGDIYSKPARLIPHLFFRKILIRRFRIDKVVPAGQNPPLSCIHRCYTLCDRKSTF